MCFYINLVILFYYNLLLLMHRKQNVFKFQSFCNSNHRFVLRSKLWRARANPARVLSAASCDVTNLRRHNFVTSRGLQRHRRDVTARRAQIRIRLWITVTTAFPRILDLSGFWIIFRTLKTLPNHEAKLLSIIITGRGFASKGSISAKFMLSKSLQIKLSRI